MDVFIDGARADAGQVIGGLLSGLAPFETCRVQQGRIPLEVHHLGRLRAACAHFGLQDPATDWEAQVPQLSGRVREGVLRIAVVPRGAPAMPDEGCVLVIVHQPLPQLPMPVAVGISRYMHPIPYAHKVPHATLRGASIAARAGGRHDDLLMGPDGTVIGASMANVAWVRDSTFHTIDDAAGGLPGLAQAGLRLGAVKQGIPTVVARPSVRDLQEADELYLTNAVRLMVPVGVLGGVAVGPGGGPVGAAALKQFTLT